MQQPYTGSGSPSSTCAGNTSLVLHADQALSHGAAADFCRQRHGAAATLPGPAELEAARSALASVVVSAAWPAHLPDCTRFQTGPDLADA